MLTTIEGHAPRRMPREPMESVHVKTPDGFTLATDVYLPRNVKRCGTVLVRLPYGKRGPIALLPGLAELVVDRGWALVAQDVRGKFDSTGALDPFVHEQSDGWHTLEWITTRTWSDGRVVAAGDSYFGYTAWAAAASGHPALRGLMVRVTSPHIQRDWMYRDGVFMLGNMTEWAASTWMASEWNDVMMDWSIRPASEILARAFAGRRCAAYDAWAGNASGVNWAAINVNLAAALRRPLIVSHVGGWWDLFQRGQVRTWADSLALDRQGVHLLTMDAVDHVLDPFLRPGEKGVDVVADQELRLAGLPQEWAPLLEILDLLDDRVDLPDRVRWRPGLGDWKGSDQWPPEASSILRLYPIEGRNATQSPEGGMLAFRTVPGGAAVWTHDPDDPVPTVETDLWRPLLSSGDHSVIHHRSDVATFTSPPMQGGMSIIGPAMFHAEVYSSSGSGHLMATLCHIWPDGTASAIGDGAAHFHSANGPVHVTVDFGNIGYRLPEGERLRLVVTASNFPRYALHPGTDEPPFEADRFESSEIRVQLGDNTVVTITTCAGD